MPVHFLRLRIRSSWKCFRNCCARRLHPALRRRFDWIYRRGSTPQTEAARQAILGANAARFLCVDI